MFFVELCFKNPIYNFCTSIDEMSKEEIEDDLIGSVYNFSYKNGGLETCIAVKIKELKI